MAAFESCDEVEPMSPDSDEDPRITAVFCDPLAARLSSQLAIWFGV